MCSGWCNNWVTRQYARCNNENNNKKKTCDSASWVYPTNSMVRSPSSEANRSSASQEIPINLWNKKINYRIFKRPPPDPILCQINSVHTFLISIVILTSHLHLVLPSGIREVKYQTEIWIKVGSKYNKNKYVVVQGWAICDPRRKYLRLPVTLHSYSNTV